MSWSRYFDLLFLICGFQGTLQNKYFMRWKLASINFKIFCFSDWCFISHQKPELSFKPLITGKTSVIINSTALLYGLAVISCCSSLPVSMINFSRQRICLFLFCSWQPPALPHRLQCSTIGRLRLNHRVRDGYGCGPKAHRHQEFLRSFWQ